jgi:hypothetical protein
MLSDDAISGKEGTVYVIAGERRVPMANVISCEADVEYNKAEVPVVGNRAMGYKDNGWSGTGTLTLYYNQSFLRDDLLDYIKNGNSHYYEIEVINDDKGSRAGRHMTVLKRVKFDSMRVAAMNIDEDSLQEELAFTFEDIEIPTRFTDLPEMAV